VLLDKAMTQSIVYINICLTSHSWKTSDNLVQHAK